MKPGSASLLLVLLGGFASRAASQEGAVVGAAEYEGWRQYSVQCARCHGQDALPNPVAANLLVSMAPGGPTAEKATFTQVVTEGRPDRGMPAFKDTMTPEQVDAVYAYLKGRAEKQIPAGRPKEPAGQQKQETPG
ncbi:MAG TPA: cytochrome c [Gemmatimonadales bacterium]|nr:cytochrome c [Gemmatimonadales bacterium]